jgi:hypothetical protein
MDASTARKHVKGMIHWLRWATGLQNWTVDVEICSLDDDHVGVCWPDPRYKRATIHLDATGFESKADLARTLRHELLHAVNAEMQRLRGHALRALTTDEGKALLECTYQECSEAGVRSMEDMLDQMGLTPKRMVKLAKAMEKSR